jgi:ABC-type bacteriocin/lantibiotic exporter with double-glycine peptidase domain
VSNKRIKELLTADEIDTDSIDRQLNTNGKLALCIQSADFTWEFGKTSSPILRNISFEVENGQLVTVTGRVGVGKLTFKKLIHFCLGKSSLLSAILGEMEKLRGYVGVRGKLAYTSQEVWIQNVTLRENIVFGQPFNEQLYNRVIKACALNADLAILPHGDMTEIGEKGVNLSGGQKARVSLARYIDFINSWD